MRRGGDSVGKKEELLASTGGEKEDDLAGEKRGASKERVRGEKPVLFRGRKEKSFVLIKG